MKKYLLTWDAGYGENVEVIEARNHNEAEQEAYRRWHEEAEASSDYTALLFNKALAELYGLEDELT